MKFSKVDSKNGTLQNWGWNYLKRDEIFKIENARIWKLPKIEIEKGLANRKCNINAIQFEDSSPNVEM